MKKKLLSMLLAALMLLTLLPVTALAEEIGPESEDAEMCLTDFASATEEGDLTETPDGEPVVEEPAQAEEKEESPAQNLMSTLNSAPSAVPNDGHEHNYDENGLCTSCGDHNGNHTKWIAWGDDDAEKSTLPTTAGNYYLVDTITVTSGNTEIKNNTLHLDLNGHTIDFDKSNTNFNLLLPGENGKLYVYDSSPDKTGGITCIGNKNNRAFGVVDNGELYLYGGTISDFQCSATGQGGAVCVDGNSGSKFYMYGGTITGGTATKGGAVGMGGNDALFAMYGGTITGCSATQNGGGGVYICNNTGTFNMYGGTITNCTTSNCNGGGVCVEKGTFNMYGGTITGCSSSDNFGGGVYLTGTTSSFNMYGGSITGNTAKTGGGVNVDSYSTFTMNGGSITGNTATSTSGGVYVTSTGTFKMAGGSITGNTAVISHGGVYSNVDNIERFILGGTAVIKNNTKGALGSKTPSNLSLGPGRTISLGTGTEGGQNGVPVPAAGMSVGVTMADGTGAFTGTATADDAKYFFADAAGKGVKFNSDKLEVIDGHAHDGVEFTTPWTSDNSLPVTAGSYYLTQDVTLSSVWLVPNGTTNLCLNGHVIKQTTDNVKILGAVGSEKILNIYDCGTTKHDGYIASTTNLWTEDAGDAHNGEADEYDIIGGIITGVHGTTVDGAMSTNGATFTINGGNIVGNACRNGGGIYVITGSVTMNGGSIVGNTASGTGGAVYESNSGTMNFTMNGGMISNNTANYGGGVYVTGKEGVSFTMTGGTITGNTAEQKGGGVYSANPAVVTLGGTAKITGNKVGTAANNVHLLSGVITIGTESNAPAEGMEVGVTLGTTDGTGAFTGAATSDDVPYFFADAAGKVVKFDSSENKLKIADIQIHDGITFEKWTSSNSLPDTAGSYYLDKDVTLSAQWQVPTGTTNLCLNGHVIKQGTANTRVIYVPSNATLNLYDCDTTKEHKGTLSNDGFFWTWDGGANTGATVIKGGIITGGSCVTTSKDATTGAIWVQGTFVMNGGTIAGCGPAENKEAICSAVSCDSGTITMNGGTIEYCRVNRTSDGAYKTGAVLLSGTGKFTMNTGATIQYCQSSGGGGAQGGAIGVKDGSAVITINGGTIDHCKADIGAGIFLTASAKLDFNDGTISNCYTSGYGCAIGSDGSCAVTIKGGHITGNNSAGNTVGLIRTKGAVVITGGEISNNTFGGDTGCVSFDTLTLGGTAVIKDNRKTDGTPQNLYLPSGKTITLGTEANAPKSGMKVGVTTATAPVSGTPVQITAGNSTSDALPYFFSDNSSYYLGVKDSKLYLSVKPTITVAKYQVSSVDVPNPVYGTAENARQLFTVTQKDFVPTATLKVEWMNYDAQGAATWTDLASASDLVLAADGKVTTSATTPAGDYTFRITNGATGTDMIASGEMKLTVEKASISPTVNITGWTYGQSAHSPSVTDNPGSGAVTYQYKVSGALDGTYSATVPTNAGTYTVKATVATTTNFKAGSDTADFTIAKADQSTPGAGEGYKLDDLYITIATGYEVSASEDFGSKIVSGTQLTDGSTYYIRKAGDENHNPSSAAAFTAKVNEQSGILRLLRAVAAVRLTLKTVTKIATDFVGSTVGVLLAPQFIRTLIRTAIFRRF